MAQLAEEQKLLTEVQAKLDAKLQEIATVKADYELRLTLLQRDINAETEVRLLSEVVLVETVDDSDYASCCDIRC